MRSINNNMDILCKGESVSKQSAQPAAQPAVAAAAAQPAVAAAAAAHHDHIPKAIEAMIEANKEYKKFSGACAGKKLRVLFCGTYPIGQSNGYSRVVYYISRYLGLKDDIELTIYGFQNYNQTSGSVSRNDIPKNVILHDALAAEQPRRNGFGELEIGKYILAHPQDIVIIFNDMIITSAIVQNIVQVVPPNVRQTFQLVSYMDQVYPYQKKCFMQLLNHFFDRVVTFTPYWMDVARSLGLNESIQTDFFPHGFDPQRVFPVPRSIARQYFNLDPNACIVLNLNRNQPRKRWDLTMMVLAEAIAQHQTLKKSDPTVRPLKLLVGAPLAGVWDLFEILESELRRKGLSPALGKEYILTIARPQMLSDREINILYNACDIGLNTCEGEGFGLCQFEHAALGCPQIAGNIGGFREFLNNDMSIVLDPIHRYYIDKQRDSIGGIAEVCDVKQFADGIMKYFTEPDLVAQHGKRARAEILQHYRWETMVDHFHKVLKKAV